MIGCVDKSSVELKPLSILDIKRLPFGTHVYFRLCSGMKYKGVVIATRIYFPSGQYLELTDITDEMKIYLDEKG